MIESIVLGGGCFWCGEAIFRRMKGVTKATSGYAGATTPNPTTEQVYSGTTGHAEVVKVDYDHNSLKLENLLELFFAMHDPTSIDCQGADVGSEYRSIILYSTPSQKAASEKFMKKIAKDFPNPIVTQLQKLDKFYPAEAYHKDFYEKNRLQPYCMLVISPKLHKLKKKFGLLG